MTKLEALIEEARQLPVPDRQRLVAEVERSLESDGATPAGSGSYAPLLSIAGKFPSHFTDVSTDKYSHL
jgi:hypothetical protein